MMAFVGKGSNHIDLLIGERFVELSSAFGIFGNPIKARERNLADPMFIC